MNYRLSDSAHNLAGQPMFKILTKVQEMERRNLDIIHFEIGDPDFSTPENITEAAINSLKAGEVHYTSSKGLFDFQKTVVEVTSRSRGFTPNINQVVITPGANIIIYYAVLCCVNPGDDVIVPDPGFPTYYSVLKLCGVNPIRVPLLEKNEFRMNPDDIRKAVTPNTRMIIINSPQNPTGALMTPDEIKEIYDIAEDYDLYLYSDEIYVRMIYDDTVKFSSPSIYDHCKKRTIVANGFSKAFAMTGWRLGTVIAPEDVAEKFALMLETTSSCVPPFIQRAGIEAAVGDQGGNKIMMNEYAKRRDIIVDGLNDIKNITCVKPGGAFYVFPNIAQTGLSSEKFAELALDKAGVALLPGTNFGINGEGYIRLCYANSVQNIERGIDRLKKMVESL